MVPRHQRLALPLLAAAALLGTAPACESEPPTVQLVIRADDTTTAWLLDVTVRVTALIRTTGGDVVLCIPCERTFHPNDGGAADRFPLVVDFVRHATPYQEAWFVVTYRSEVGPGFITTGRLYHRMTWPDEGVASHTVEIQQRCLTTACTPGWHCIDGTCHLSVPEVPPEILDEAWGTRPCSDSCSGPAADADADTGAEARLDADADADAPAEIPTEADSPTDVPAEADVPPP
ncbi:MAG: hypothetical protein JXB32_19955 [Deltaproteobacteria bacterium]|nr:hypothetical protein [Deltaproteobacteria bacterium]